MATRTRMRRVQQQVLDALLGQELAVAGLGDGDHHQEDDQDGEFCAS
ncbi:hypothetical protein [Streptomyces shaanxiensis]